jgi:hypothetical protein
MADTDVNRREILTKAAYVTPAVVTLPVLLSFASSGSGNRGDQGNPGDRGDQGNRGGNRGNRP